MNRRGLIAALVMMAAMLTFVGCSSDDDGDNNNTVYSITMTSPSGGSTLTVATVHVIRWTDQNVDSFKVEYSINGGTDYTVVAATVVVDTFAWTVPNTPSATCKIRVSKVGDATVFATTGTFTIALPPIVGTWDATDNTIEPLGLDSLAYNFNVEETFSRLFRVSQTTVIESGTYETDDDSLRFHVTISDGQPANEIYAFWYSLAQNNTILTIRITEASEVYPVTFTRVP